MTARRPSSVLEVAVDEETTINLVNNGQSVHHMRHVAGVDNRYEVHLCEVGGDGPCSDPSAGEYFFRCDVHPGQMTGTLIVG